MMELVRKVKGPVLTAQEVSILGGMICVGLQELGLRRRLKDKTRGRYVLRRIAEGNSAEKR